MYRKYSNHVNKYFPFIKQNFHLFIEFSVDFLSKRHTSYRGI